MYITALLVTSAPEPAVVGIAIAYIVFLVRLEWIILFLMSFEKLKALALFA